MVFRMKLNLLTKIQHLDYIYRIKTGQHAFQVKFHAKNKIQYLQSLYFSQ